MGRNWVLHDLLVSYVHWYSIKLWVSYIMVIVCGYWVHKRNLDLYTMVMVRDHGYILKRNSDLYTMVMVCDHGYILIHTCLYR